MRRLAALVRSYDCRWSRTAAGNRFSSIRLPYNNPCARAASQSAEGLPHNRSFSSVSQLLQPISAARRREIAERSARLCHGIHAFSRSFSWHTHRISWLGPTRSLPAPSLISSFSSLASLSGAAVWNPPIVTSPDGTKQYAALMMPDGSGIPKKKLKPSIVARRLSKMHTFIGQQKEIRYSAWKLNLVCSFITKLTVPEALLQLQYNNKKVAPILGTVITRTANVADMKYGLQPSQLEIAECFATKGTPLKRIKIMGRGRTGRKTKPVSHIRLVLRQVDFKLRIYQASLVSLRKQKHWFELSLRAQQDHEAAQVKRSELQQLEKQQHAVNVKATQ
jgi:large subunit ribosomal protein L22